MLVVISARHQSSRFVRLGIKYGNSGQLSYTEEWGFYEHASKTDSQLNSRDQHRIASDCSKGFSRYVESIHELVQLRESVDSREWFNKLAHCLNGEPYQVLFEHVPKIDLKRQGAYFTGFKLARKMAKLAINGKSVPPRIYDPACGAGDLLLATAQQLPRQSTFRDTLHEWGKLLAGSDVSAQFVRLAKLRLTLLAAKRHGIQPPFDSSLPSAPFPHIKVADSLAPLRPMPCVDVVIMNPPFGYTTAPADCEWASGRVNSAAVFVDRAVRDASDGTRIVALLPDVLRSGSRYVKWRNKTHASGSIISEKSLGLFDHRADVDIYLLHFKRNSDQDKSDSIPPPRQPTYGIGKRFAVRVGPVVPHRHAETGPLAPYVNARTLAPWVEYSAIASYRRFEGRLFSPPFVCVKRTSRPDCGPRAVATLVLGKTPVAVENHLIALLPHDGTARTCRELMLRLASPKSDKWLNARLRCRHLTTSAVSEMPWWYKP